MRKIETKTKFILDKEDINTLRKADELIEVLYQNTKEGTAEETFFDDLRGYMQILFKEYIEENKEVDEEEQVDFPHTYTIEEIRHLLRNENIDQRDIEKILEPFYGIDDIRTNCGDINLIVNQILYNYAKTKGDI